jgi:hypothetical protein
MIKQSSPRSAASAASRSYGLSADLNSLIFEGVRGTNAVAGRCRIGVRVLVVGNNGYVSRGERGRAVGPRIFVCLLFSKGRSAR